MTTILGIRHHGPGCARSVVRALDSLQPDLVLIEGPPDADEWMHVAGDAAIKPPVALLVYGAVDSSQASFYPFAEFSPEWQAMRWAARQGVDMRFLDLPCAHRFVLEEEAAAARAKENETTESDGEETPQDGPNRSYGTHMSYKTYLAHSSDTLPPPSSIPRSFTHDPILQLAKADGYSDGERWWNDRVEEREDDADFFEAILAGMSALRQELALPESPLDLKREAWMRRGIREAEKSGAQRIVMICGAWHAPALVQPVKASEDAALLKGLPKTKVKVTWTPWSLERLTTASGYGAGVESPGWYAHLWKAGPNLIERWIIKAARLLRKAGLAASSASVIESVRLSTALAGLRGRPRPGLPETMEAMTSVFCQGDATPLQTFLKKLLVGEALGELPEGLPLLPLHEDIQQQQKSLRLKPTAGVVQLDLDLREDIGQARSIFLHRMEALHIPLGKKTGAPRGKGTFKEAWLLKWEADLVLAIVDASRFGNDTASAAAARLAEEASKADQLEPLVNLLETSLLADLPAAGQAIMAQVAAAAATGEDPAELLKAIPPLARLARYGNVRQSDLGQVQQMAVTLAVRVHAELPPAVSGLDDEAAQVLGQLLTAHEAALRLLEDEPLLTEWRALTALLMEHATAHPLLRGLATRLQRDAGALDANDCARQLEYALSAGQDPGAAVSWISGFLSGSGTVLIHDTPLLALLHHWMAGLTEEHFQQILPLLRRTFGQFTGPERAKIGHAVTTLDPDAKPSLSATATPALVLDETRSLPAVALTARLLGLTTHPDTAA